MSHSKKRRLASGSGGILWAVTSAILMACIALPGPTLAKFDPPRIIQKINPLQSGTIPDSLLAKTRYYINRGQETSINRGDILNVYRERRVSRYVSRPLRIFIGTMAITDSQQGSSIGEFRPSEAAMSQPIIRHKTALKGDYVVPRLIIDSGVLFDAGAYDLRAGAGEEFAKVAGFVENFSPSKLVIEGHTDADGDAGTNMKLSERWAQQVRNYLIQTYEFITAGMIDAKGYGEERPIVNNDTRENKSLNRRIEVIVWE